MSTEQALRLVQKEWKQAGLQSLALGPWAWPWPTCASVFPSIRGVQVKADLSQLAWVLFLLGPFVCLSVYPRMTLEGAGVESGLTNGTERS